jgi:hypothetical protein
MYFNFGQFENAADPISVTLPGKPYWEEEAAGGLFLRGGLHRGKRKIQAAGSAQAKHFFAYAQAHEVRHRG